MSSRHFTEQATSEPTSPGRYVDVSAVPSVEFVPGLEFRPVVGEKTMANFVTFQPNTVAPVHVHAEEQIVIVLDGEFEFDIDGDVRMMRKGDVAVIPSWVPHGARTKDSSCTEVDIFNPPRASLLDIAGDAGAGGAAAAGIQE